ncbi:MAG TPA: hypothetical protein VGQ21_04805 [Thermoanaerobaculia bacterium]|jgi:hypothetical protein|nr:hypothetical protein [Thermoanaerobaculia bacterium]
MRSRRWIDALLVVAVLVTVWLLYHKVTRLWWIWDDTYLLHIVSEHRFLDSFVDGSLWLSMPQQIFTPLLTASYHVELALFGLNPVPFYVVHLTEVAAIAIALAFALRLWMSREAAACAAFLFLVGTPVAVMAAQLVLMHYVESVILSIVAAALFARAMRTGRKLPVITSALLYLLAMLAKEIAVPLLPVLLILPERDLRARIRAVWPHGIALLIYFAWRYAILGKLIGGYGWTFGPGEIPLLLVRTVARIVGTFAGPRIAIGIPFVILILLGILLRLRSRFSAVAIAVAFVAAIGPIVPVAAHYEHRFAWCAWICTAIVFAAGTDALRNRRLALSMMIAAPLLGSMVNRQQWKNEFTLAKRMSDEGRVFTDLEAGDFIRMPAIPPGEMFQVAWVKEFLLHRPAGTMWFYDDLYLCSGQKPRRVFGFDERTKQVREMTPEIPAIATRYCASFRDAPLDLHFHYDEHRHLLTWDLGPYDDGYTVVSGNGFLAYDVKRHDGLQLFGMKDLTFRLRYRSPAGWVTYSPEQMLDFSRDRDLTWRR